jgi:periplasmic protein CpxP/Spy
VKNFATFAIALLMSGPVFAQTAAPAAAPAATPAPKAAPNEANASSVAARVDKRIAHMHAQLKITPEQETAWNAFAQVMRTNVTATDDAYKQRSATLATMSAPDNMANFAQIEQARAQGIQNLATAFQTLYSGFSDDQKKIADTMFRRYGQHEGRHKHGAK